MRTALFISLGIVFGGVIALVFTGSYLHPLGVIGGGVVGFAAAQLLPRSEHVQRRSTHDWTVPMVRYRAGDGYVDTTHDNEE